MEPLCALGIVAAFAAASCYCFKIAASRACIENDDFLQVGYEFCDGTHCNRYLPVSMMRRYEAERDDPDQSPFYLCRRCAADYDKFLAEEKANA